MAVFRQVHIDFWQDGFVLDLTPEEKYFYLYLMTNSKTTQCGVYELPRRIIETETGYNRETVEKLLDRFSDYKKIVYDKSTNEIFIANWVKYNKVVSPKVIKCVEKELSKIKSEALINLFIRECNRYQYPIDIKNMNTTMDRVSIPIPQVDFDLKNHYGEEKEKEQKEEKEKNINKNKVSEFAKLYEQNIGLINGVASEWLIELSESLDVKLFKKAIEIATDNGKCNKGYVNGIIKKWRDNNIKNYDDLKAFELSKKNKGGSEFGEYGYEYGKTRYQRKVEEEDESLYRKPTEEELAEFRKYLEENTKL